MRPPVTHVEPPAESSACLNYRLPALPEPRLPDALTIEICCDDGEWHCCTINTSVAAILLSDDSVARLPINVSQQELAERFMAGFLGEKED